MNIYLQHRGTKRFFSTRGDWTVDEAQARRFASSSAAAAFRSEECVRDAEVFLRCPNAACASGTEATNRK